MVSPNVPKLIAQGHLRGLPTRRFHGFCIVSSDSDFTGLAMRLREEGLSVHGFGEEKTPLAFRNVCHKFITVEVLASQDPASEQVPLPTKVKPKPSPATTTNSLPVAPIPVAPPPMRLRHPQLPVSQPTRPSNYSAMPLPTC